MKKINLKALKAEHVLAVLSAMILLLIIYPLLKIAQYNYPSCDDFSYGIQTYKTFCETGSVWDTLKAALAVAKEFYYSWQGSFTAIFLMAIQPAVWNIEAYAITTYITIGALMISELWLVHFWVVDLCRSTRSCATIIGCLMVSMQIFWIQSPVEAFFWFNGSVYYTFFYALMLFLLIVIMKRIRSESKGTMSIILSVVLAFFIGGGNYPAALLTVEIITCLLVWLVIKKRNKILTILPCYVSLLIAFAINIAAPGNAVRQSNNQKMPALKSIVVAVLEGINFIERWSVLPVLLVFMILTPFLWKCVRNTDHKFRYPVIITLLSVGLFSSQLTPTLYAQSSTGPGRLINVVYYTYYLLILGNMTYWMGWVRHKIDESIKGESELNVALLLQSCFGKYQLALVAVLACSFLVSVKYYGFHNTVSMQAWSSMINGEAAQYELEQQERYRLLQDEDLKQVGLSEFTVKPAVLYFDDIEEDQANWKNKAMTDFFGKEAVWLVPR